MIRTGSYRTAVGFFRRAIAPCLRVSSGSGFRLVFAARRVALLLLGILVLAGTPANGQASTEQEVNTPLYSDTTLPLGESSEVRGGPGMKSALALPGSNTDSPPNGRTVKATRSPRVGMIDAATKWQFVTRESIAISSSIIRLSDVIRPLEPRLNAWKRLAGSTIGLMPSDGGDAKLSRNRLANLIAGAEATPERIKIYGPETIVVRRAGKTLAGKTNVRSTNTTSKPPIAPVQYSQAQPAPQRQPVDHEQLERMQQYTIAMIRNQYRDLFQSYQIQVEFDPDQLTALAESQGIRHLKFLDEVPDWTHTMSEPIEVRARVDGRAVGEDQQGIARLTLTPYPAIVAARAALRRGQRVARGDLQYLPYSAEGISLPGDVVKRPEDIVDMEVIGLVRRGVALSHAAFAAPRVLRRGDLIEVQVGGGGVRVTTGAKALDDGAVDDLIEIQTLSPKRRLLARVVHSTLVEIITQAPHVRGGNPENSQSMRQR